MLSELARNWWIPLIRGLAAIAFGIMAFAWPGITLFALVLLFGVYAIIDGLAAIWFAIIERNQAMNWWGMLLVGLLSVAAGIVAIFWPGITAMALLMVIAAWAIVRGIFEIVAAIQLRKHIENEWALGLGGALSILFGIMLIVSPGAGAIALIWVIAAFELAFGVFSLMLAWRMRGLHHRLRAT